MSEFVLAYIPARAGSKGIPGKNMRSFAGKPLLEWTLEAALGAKGVSMVAVSSDLDEAGLSPLTLRYSRVLWWRRPAELATDEARIEDGLLYHLGRIPWQLPGTVVLLQPTSPLRVAADVDRALWHYWEAHADSLLSAVAVHSPFNWSRNRDLEWIRPYGERPRRQDLHEVWLENGAIYIFNTRKFLETKDRLFGKIALYGMGPEHRYEIDDMVEWQIMEALMRQRGLAVV